MHPRMAMRANKQVNNNAQVETLRHTMQKMLDEGKGQAVLTNLLDVVAALQEDNARLLRRAMAAERARFLRKSEKLGAEDFGQLVLALGGSEAEAHQPNAAVPTPGPEEENVGAGTPDGAPVKPPKGSKKGKHPGRTRLGEHLKRNIHDIPVPADERSCLHCGEEMQAVGHIDHECIEFFPARIEVRVDRREKVACKSCKQDITAAPRPAVLATTAKEDLAPGAHVYRRAGASLMAQLLESKCDDGMPIYRQRQQLARLGFDAPLNTLYGYWRAAGEVLQPVAHAILSRVLGSSVVGLDDTRLDWLDPAQKSKRRRGHLWCFMGDGPLVAFEFTETWCAEDVAPWIQAIDGFVQCDDYKGYSAEIRGPNGDKRVLVDPATRLGCWMHVRRRFHKAYKSGELAAIVGLDNIRELYRLEAEARDKGLTAEERGQLRARKSIPIADAFYAWIEDIAGRVRPTSYLGEAVRYARDQKPYVMRCLTDGRFELDTGRVERRIREPVIGRKNYLFSGSAPAAQLLAGVYTLVCSCQNVGINTREYLTDVIGRLQAGFPLRRINELLPDVWQGPSAQQPETGL